MEKEREEQDGVLLMRFEEGSMIQSHLGSVTTRRGQTEKRYLTTVGMLLVI